MSKKYSQLNFIMWSKRYFTVDFSSAAGIVQLTVGIIITVKTVLKIWCFHCARLYTVQSDGQTNGNMEFDFALANANVRAWSVYRCEQFNVNAASR